jgi:hypothetical protein
MWFLIILGGILALALGILFKFSVERLTGGEYRISNIELAIGTVVCAVIVVPLVVIIGTGMIKADKLTYHEYYNGYEKTADKQSIVCSEDGPCIHEYHCNPYTVVDSYAYTDSDGNYHPQQEHTEYHDCPYATEEHTYTVDTTLGQYTIASHIFSENPREWDGNGIPGDVERGVPEFWEAARRRIASGDPGPVTKVEDYDNYILASQKTILHDNSSAVNRLREEDLLPEPTQNADDPIRDFYYADKISFVGPKGVKHPADEREWSDALSRFNAALGSDLQGDLHVAVIDADLVSNPDEYAQAVHAWWQDPEFGKNAVSKNSIIVVMGVDYGTVVWARAFTGMPYGNEAMLTDIQNELKGVAFTPGVVLGKPKGVIAGDEVTVQHADPPGQLESVVWGVHQFERVCMLCNDEGEESGTSFGYLGDEIQPSSEQKMWLIIIALFISTAVWSLFVYLPIGETRSGRFGALRDEL